MALPAMATTPVHSLVNQPELAEPFLYHDPTRFGFTSLFTPHTQPKQHSFHLHELSTQLARMGEGHRDVYIAQSEFHKASRRITDCARLTTHFLDLDTYKVPALTGLSAEHLTGRLLIHCDDRGIPEPSVIVFSGRGLQCKWLLEEPVPASALPRWSAVQGEMLKRFATFGADNRAIDAARVLRLVGSVNSRSGQAVRIVHRARTPTMGACVRGDGAVVFDFETLAETMLPRSRRDLQGERTDRAELEAWAADEREADARRREAVRRDSEVADSRESVRRRNSGCRPLVPSTLAWDRLEDLRRLVKIRGWHDGVPAGHRDAFLFLGACFLVTSKLARQVRSEVRALATEFTPSLSDSEVRGSICTVLNRADAAARGEKVEFHGEQVDPRYRFGNARLVELLDITASEQRELRTIIGKDESRRRDAERHATRRRADGCVPRAEYELQGAARAAQARELRAQQMSYAQIAAALCISRTAAHFYCNRT